MGEYTRGVAFVLEGATEKVFYRAFLKWFAEQNNCSFVKGANNCRATKVTSTQGEAIRIARDIARNHHSEMRVQGNDGKFRTCNSYGNDPCPPRDKNL